MREQHSSYEYSIVPEQEMWGYEIYDPRYKNEIFRVSDESYETAQEARFAAIGHISMLEDGEG